MFFCVKQTSPPQIVFALLYTKHPQIIVILATAFVVMFSVRQLSDSSTLWWKRAEGLIRVELSSPVVRIAYSIRPLSRVPWSFALRQISFIYGVCGWARVENDWWIILGEVYFWYCLLSLFNGKLRESVNIRQTFVFYYPGCWSKLSSNYLIYFCPRPATFRFFSYHWGKFFDTIRT